MEYVVREFNWMLAAQSWAVVVLAACGVGFLLGTVRSAAAHGSLTDGFTRAVGRVAEFYYDLIALSPRRLLAVTKHTILESIRRRMLFAVLAVFIVLFLFAGWYLPGRPIEQVKVYVSFVMLSATIIAIVASGLLACLGLPSDIKDKTIHTVVTKPVRRLEIVLGRVLGLTAVATVVLSVMGVISYAYLLRSTSGAINQLRQQISIAEERGDKDHVDKLKDDIEQIESKLVARMPIFAEKLVGPAKLVGHESEYRKYIEGNKLDAGIWHFRGLPVAQILAQQPPRLPLEMTFEVFRTTKGQVGKGVIAEITFRNGKNPNNLIRMMPFEVREYYVNQQVLLDTPDRSLAALLQGSDGDLDIEVRCLSGGQYLGMAHADLYVLLESASFGLNFAKGILGVWMRVVLIICVAVMFSTVLSSFVAMEATLAAFMGGLSMDHLRKVAMGHAEGGGPIQAAMRIFTHENLQRPLDPGFWTNVALESDKGLGVFLRGLVHVLPDLSFYNTAPLVAHGFNIGPSVLLQGVVAMLAYAIPFTIAGYFLLQSREIAR